jgi:hypothetical protein
VLWSVHCLHRGLADGWPCSPLATRHFPLSSVDAPLAGVLQCLQREERNRSTLTVITKSLPYLNDDNNNDNEVCVRGQGLVTR